MYLRFLATAALVAVAAFAQTDSPFQVRYAANLLTIGDSFIYITNSGASGADLQSGTTADITGAICVNVFTFSSDEQMVSCCSCPVTPNGLVALSVNRDLTARTLTQVKPNSVVVKLFATVPVAGSCTNSARTLSSRTPANGMIASGTSRHGQGIVVTGSGICIDPQSANPVIDCPTTETRFAPATMSAGELNRLGALCNFIEANGSGHGLCSGCALTITIPPDGSPNGS